MARVGETVLLKCRVDGQKGQVIWMKGDIGLGYKRDLPFWERMSMVGSVLDGEYHLEIRNVSLDDEDTYQCQLSSTTEQPHAKLSRRAKLTVIVEPHGPLLLGEFVALAAAVPQRSQPIASSEGQPLRVSCQSRGGKPPAQLAWAVAEDWEAQRLIGHIGNGSGAAEDHPSHYPTFRHPMGSSSMHPMRAREHLPVHYSSSSSSSRHARTQHNLHGNITEFVEFDEDTLLYTVTSHLIFTPTKEENGRWLVCMAAHPSYPGHEWRTATIQMDIFYAPKVRVELDMANSQLREGGHARLRCVSDARPNDDLKYSWHWDGEPKRLEVLDNENALIPVLRFNDNGKRVSCSVANAIGAGNGVLELDVHYGPQFMSTNQTRTVEPGTVVTFQCEVLGNPVPRVLWYHGRDWETPVFEGKNYTIVNAHHMEEGEYRCTAHVDGFPAQTLYHMLYLKGPPQVRLSEFVVSDGGKTMTLVCQIQSRSLPVHVHWFHNGQRVDIDNDNNNDGGAVVQIKAKRQEQQRQRRLQHFRVEDERIARHELVSRLTINDVTSDEYGPWNCSAKNEYGVVWDQRDVYLLGMAEKFERFVRAHFPSMELLFGAVAFAALLSLAMCAMCLCCCCRNRNRHPHRSSSSAFCCCCCCFRGRGNGHSKLSSNYSSDKGDVSVKVEELGSHGGGTPSFTQQQQQQLYANAEPTMPQPTAAIYHDPSYYMSAPGQFNPDLNHHHQACGDGQTALLLANNNNNGIATGTHQFNDFFSNGIGTTTTTTFLTNGGGSGTDGWPPMGNAYDLGFGGVDGIGTTETTNSFGIQYHQLQQQQQQPLYYHHHPSYGAGMSPLKTVTEVCTPESREDSNGHIGGTQQGIDQQLASGNQQQQHPPMERTISRISTHV